MENLITYIVSGCSALMVGLSSVLALLTKLKNGVFKKADNIYERMLTAMVTAENMYAPMKASGFDVSAMKKQYVISDLQTYALSNKIKFDVEKWSEEIENMIKFSNEINSSKGGLI